MGLDLGDRYSYVAALSRDGDVLLEDRVATTREAFGEFFRAVEAGTRIVLEAGTHSPWVSALFAELGHDFVVANPRNAGRALAATGKKNDRSDALTLAQLGFSAVKLLRPITHKSQKAQEDLVLIRARAAVIRMRTLAVNSVRGLVKSSGHRLPASTTASFHLKALKDIPEELRAALLPLLEQIGNLTQLIRSYDKQIKALAESYPEAGRLQGIAGVGPLVSTAFVLTIDDPGRFKRSRDVGAYLGLVPKQHESGNSKPQLRITKAGDTYLRQLLIGSAQYILGPFGPDCQLRRFGERVGSRGAAKGKKRAVTAVARKLAVLMHRMLVTAEPYDPFYGDSKKPRRMRA